jgi:glyoxylase-like metal-dependent hydrolase (beta-lactamase superfamily II)
MKIYPLNTGNFKLDGGAMFGVVPKSLWQRTNPADENNLCNWAMRSMLIEDGDRLILIDNGIGDKQDDKFFSHYYLNGDDSLDGNLAKLGFHKDDITDVFLTHLHFDHCGGSIVWNKDRTLLVPAFKNAVYWSNERHWNWATKPNPREKASFLAENILPIQENGQLQFLERPESGFGRANELGFDIFFADGHTEAQMIPFIKYQEKTVIFAADLLPSAGHIPLPYVMGYDTRPLITMDEKARFLKMAADEGMYIFFEHDFQNELCSVKNTEKGVRLDSTFAFSEVFG